MAKDSTIRKLTNSDLKRIESLLSSQDTDVANLGLGLIEELRFSMQTLRKLKADIRKNGVVVEMSQGKYSITRTNPALQTYNVSIKNYQSIVTQLSNLLNSLNLNEDDDFESDTL